jgi:hypothetical protein
VNFGEHGKSSEGSSRTKEFNRGFDQALPLLCVDLIKRVTRDC